MTTDIATPVVAPGRLSVGSLDGQHPWLGLLPYEEEHAPFYRGRTRDVEQVLRLVRRDRFSLLIGRSGLGKTSLIRAGLFPKWRASNCLPVYVRLDYAPGAPRLVEQVKRAIAAAAEDAKMKAPEPREEDSLWAYLHQAGGEFWTREHMIALPIVVFDQFEEIFTLGADAEHVAPEDLVLELSDLIEDRVPRSIRQRLAQEPGEAGRYALQRHHYKLVMSLREDFLADLDQLSYHLPSALFQNRWRVTAMSGLQGLEVVEDPGDDLISRDVAEQVVRRVAQQSVGATSGALEDLELDPAILSLFCRRLNEERIRRRENQITRSLLDRFGDEILLEFYEDSLVRLPGARPRWQPDYFRRQRIHDYIERHLLTDDDRRDSADFAMAGRALGARAVSELVGRRLLRIDPRGSSPRVELAHDVLTEQVRRSGRRRRGNRIRFWTYSALGVVVLVVLAALWLNSQLEVDRLNEVIDDAIAEADTLDAEVQAARADVAGMDVAAFLDELDGRVGSLRAALEDTTTRPTPDPLTLGPTAADHEIFSLRIAAIRSGTARVNTHLQMAQSLYEQSLFDAARAQLAGATGILTSGPEFASCPPLDATGAGAATRVGAWRDVLARAAPPARWSAEMGEAFARACHNRDLLLGHAGLAEELINAGAARLPSTRTESWNEEWRQAEDAFNANEDRITAIVQGIETDGN